MKDIFGNKTEENINNFLNKLDSDVNIGPKPLNGFEFNKLGIAMSLDCSNELALKLFKTPSQFFFDDNDEVFVLVRDDNTGIDEKFYLTSRLEDPSFESSVNNILLNLPEVEFDLECGGYQSRQSEAAAIYKIAVINALQEGQYDEQIKICLKGYDFERMLGVNGNYAFTELLQIVQEEADSISRVVLMSCNNKLIAERVKKDTSYKGILLEEDAEKLRVLSDEDSRINFEFNNKYKKASTNKEKVMIGEEIAFARKAMLDSKHVSPDFQVLFSIYKLNQNAIPGRAKRRIRNAASNYVSELVDSNAINDNEAASEFKKKIITRAQKLYLSRMKQIRYKAWASRTFETDLSSLIPKY